MKIHKLEKILNTLYNWAMKKPILWDLWYITINNSLFSWFLSSTLHLYYNKVASLIRNQKADLLVITHPYWNYLLHKIKKNREIKTISIITDSYSINRLWLNKNIDYYITIDEETKLKIESLGIDRQKIKVLGFPVDTSYFEEFDRKQLLEQLGLSPSLFTILIVIGIGNVKNFFKIIKHLQSFDKNSLQLIIITSRRKAVYNKLVKNNYQIKTRIIYWTDRMADFIRSSDLVITKCGGAIISEVISAGKPVFVPVRQGGQEKGNARILKIHKLGILNKSKKEMLKILDSLIRNKELLEQFSQNMIRYRKYNPCAQISKFIKEILVV